MSRQHQQFIIVAAITLLIMVAIWSGSLTQAPIKKSQTIDEKQEEATDPVPSQRQAPEKVGQQKKKSLRTQSPEKEGPGKVADPASAGLREVLGLLRDSDPKKRLAAFRKAFSMASNTNPAIPVPRAWIEAYRAERESSVREKVIPLALFWRHHPRVFDLLVNQIVEEGSDTNRELIVASLAGIYDKENARGLTPREHAERLEKLRRITQAVEDAGPHKKGSPLWLYLRKLRGSQ